MLRDCNIQQLSGIKVSSSLLISSIGVGRVIWHAVVTSTFLSIVTARPIAIAISIIIVFINIVWIVVIDVTDPVVNGVDLFVDVIIVLFVGVVGRGIWGVWVGSHIVAIFVTVVSTQMSIGVA